MTPEEITAMAKEAGFPFNKYGLLQGDDDGEIDADAAFASFTALVAEKAAAKERERFALECIDLVAFHGGSVELEAAIRARGTKEGV